jgi:hypothetical protein
MTEVNAKKLASLFEETSEAHHRSFEETDGVDPEWPWWYAGHLQDSVNEMLGATLTKSELVYLVVVAENERSLRAPGSRWPHYYAEFLLERYS